MIHQCQYHCPKCNKSLSKGTKVQLLFKKPNQEELKQILLEPEPGNYDFYTTPPTNFNQGERVEFHCPKCKTDLTSKKDNDFVELKMMVNDFIFFEALFSCIYGDKRTYIITENDIDVYGDASYDDIPFPDVSQMEEPSI